MQVTWNGGLGAVIAVIILILCIVFIAIGHLPLLIGALIAGGAFARLC
jgi:hypothetical protein